MSKIFGKADISINGTKLNTSPGAKLKMGGVKRREIVSDQQSGHTEEDVSWAIECDVLIDKNSDLDVLNESNVSATFVCDTGQRFSGLNGWFEDTVTIEGGKPSKVRLIFGRYDMKKVS